MVMDPLVYNERVLPSWKEILKGIISGAALIADRNYTRDDRRERIVAESNAVWQAWQDLSECKANMSIKDPSEGVKRANDHMCRKVRDLRRQLRKAAVDHVSDSFMETDIPILLIEAAQREDEEEMEKATENFADHAAKLVEVANLACFMSTNVDGVKKVRYAANSIGTLYLQVVCAAHILAARPRSIVAQEKMNASKDAWDTQVRILTEAVDDITTIDDFLAVSENHILEDVNKCVLALQEGDADILDRTAGAIRGRSARVANVVAAEMDNYEPGIYTERVLEAIKVLREQVMPNFATRVEMAFNALSNTPPKEVDENEFIDASRLVYDGVREIRRAVLMNRTDEELDPEDIELDEPYTTSEATATMRKEPGVDEYPDISGITTARERMVMDPLVYNERVLPSWKEILKGIISGAALIADRNYTRDDRRERIVAESNAVWQAWQDLSECKANMSIKDPSEGVKRAIDHMYRKVRDLRRQLRKAAVDHVSDSFMETDIPILALIEAAQREDEEEVEKAAENFADHANKLVEVANIACCMSSNEDGVKMVRYAANSIATLYIQVICAAQILAARPRSKVFQENMNVFKDAWDTKVRILTEAVDDITTIDDFLAVSENHILEDVNKCVLALQEGDADILDRTAGAIRGRSARVANVAAAEMDNYEPGIYTERVLEAIKVLREQVMPNFATRVEMAFNALSNTPPKEVDENEFIDASRLVYDGVREIRRAVLMNRTDEELDPEDIELDEPYTTSEATATMRKEPGVDEYPDISGITTAREAMRKMTEEDKQKIAQQVEFFRSEKLKFDKEVAKWDDTGNDIIVLAKHMCVIMMEMTDFTRGRGPLKTTMDVINAAKKISEAGTNLDKLTRQIADQCPESSTKKDLLAYLQRIALYCHQLNITSKVKADVQNISGELIVSGLDSATSLIQAAKNLMNAVVLTVKSSYVASTKYPRQGQVSSPIVVWKMKAPEKKPLVRPEKPEEVRAKVRKGSQKKVQNPIKALSEFQSPTESV